jgi:translation initiation factor 2B subunit (eIF-2B alpha/beta/delta family)
MGSRRSFVTPLKWSACKVQFRVIVIDSRLNFHASQVVEGVSELDVRYTLMSGLSYAMPEVKKAVIEACGILSNHAALTRSGQQRS